MYNGERYLAESIDALLGQSYTDFELIISDNASTDDTSLICERYAKMKREALVPIDEEVEQGITGQQQRMLARWPGGGRGCSPRRR